MAFTSPTEDIIIQEGTFAFSFECSGTVNAGQAVVPVTTGTGDICVRAVPAGADGGGALARGCVGVAAYKQTDNHEVAVYGPGNICRVIVSGTTTGVGDILYPTYSGKWIDGVHEYLVSGIHAIALEDQATANGTCKVLLF